MPTGTLYAFLNVHEPDCDGERRSGMSGCTGCEMTVHEVRVSYPAPKGHGDPVALGAARRAAYEEVQRRLRDA